MRSTLALLGGLLVLGAVVAFLPRLLAPAARTEPTSTGPAPGARAEGRPSADDPTAGRAGAAPARGPSTASSSPDDSSTTTASEGDLSPAAAAAPLSAADRAAVDRLLDGFHAAAARADLEDYFGRFTPGATFVGTDPDEVWSVTAFRAYAEPHFASGRGWTYRPSERRLTALGPDAAAFHEALDHDRYGRLHGSGAVVRGPEGWRVAQYVLAFAVPNDRAPAVLDAIAGTSKAPEDPAAGANPGG